jgi:hypothetical protein
MLTESVTQFPQLLRSIGSISIRCEFSGASKTGCFRRSLPGGIYGVPENSQRIEMLQVPLLMSVRDVA